MTRGPNLDTRILEVLCAIEGGAEIVSEILTHSSYESVNNVRRFCVDLTKAGLLTSGMRIARRTWRNASPWAHGPRAHHFALTDLGRERLAELRESAAPAAQTQA